MWQSKAAFHAPLGDGSLGRQYMIDWFLFGNWMMRPFEPIDSVIEKFVTLKEAFVFFLLCPFERVWNLQAISVAPICLEFALGRVTVVLCPRLHYVPKVSCMLSIGPLDGGSRTNYCLCFGSKANTALFWFIFVVSVYAITCHDASSIEVRLVLHML